MRSNQKMLNYEKAGIIFRARSVYNRAASLAICADTYLCTSLVLQKKAPYSKWFSNTRISKILYFMTARMFKISLHMRKFKFDYTNLITPI